MKNLFKSLMLVAVAAMAFTSCQNDIEEVNAVNKSVTLTFNAGFGEETRVDFAEAGNKAYKASWEAGDTVTFAVYEDASSDQPIEVAQTIEITEAADSVELTVSFNNLTAGNVIKAYVNYIVDYWVDYYGVKHYGFVTSYYAQEPDANGPSEVYASASVEYAAGVDYADLTFAHDYAYGLMTIKDLPFEADYFELRVNGGNQRTTVYLNKVTDNKVWFYIDEYEKVDDLEVRIVSKEDFNQQRYFVRSFGEADTFAFTKGRVSRFTIDTWYTKLADPQNVKGKLDGEKIVFTWDEVENADSYDVVVEYNYEPTEYKVETNRLELDAKGFAPFAGLDIEVVAVGTGYVNSNSTSAEFIVPVAKDDKGTHNFIYDAVEVIDVYANTFKFYQKANADNFMYLSFRQALPTSGSVVYDFDDIETTPYARSCFWMSSDLRPAGMDGFDPYYYVPSYNIGHNVYTIYPNSGDACTIYVDVEDGKYSITAFVKNDWYFGSENLFKGSFNGPLSVKETLATPKDLEAAVDGYSVTLTWGEVKGATSYEVEFAGKTEEVTTTSAKFDSVAVGYYSATVVAKAEGYNDSEAARLDNIQVKQVFDTVEIKSVVAGAVEGNYTPLTLTTVKGDVFTTKAGNGGVNYLNEGTWNQILYYDSGYALQNVYLNGNDEAHWVPSFVMEVKYVEGKYDLTIESSAGNFHFLGDITGLVVPGYEPEPESSASAVLVTGTTFNGFNPYDVTFSFANGDKVVTRFNTSGNQYLHLGAWQNDEWQKPHYISLVKLNGDEAYVSACNVAYDNNAYTVTFSVFEYNNYTTTNYTYTGAIVGLNAPEACDCLKESEQPGGGESGGESGDLTGAIILTNMSHTSYGGTVNEEGTGYCHHYLLTDASGDNQVMLCGSDLWFFQSVIDAGTYTFASPYFANIANPGEFKFSAYNVFVDGAAVALNYEGAGSLVVTKSSDYVHTLVIELPGNDGNTYKFAIENVSWN